MRAVAGILGNAILRERQDSESRTREATMRAHLESLPAITYIEYDDADSEYGYVDSYVSPQVETILGYTVDEWLNDFTADQWTENIHVDDRARVQELSESTAASGEPFIIEYRLRRKDGEWIWVRDESHLIGSSDGSRPSWHGVIMDITLRKQAEQQREFQAKLLEGISDAVIAYDEEMIVTSWNRAAQVLYGWTAEEVVGRPLPEALRYDPDDPAQSVIWDPFVEEMQGWRSKVIQRDKDGYEIPIETKGLPLLDSEGNPTGYVMVNREVADT